MKYRNVLLLGAAILGTTLQASHAQSIGINLGSGRADASLDPTDVAGVVPQENWNNLAGTTGGPVVLVDGSSAPTTTEVTWAVEEQWSIGGVPADANGILLNGFFAERNAVPYSTIDISNIPYPIYDLYIYVSHDRNSEDVILHEAGGAFADFTAVFDNTDITASVTFSRQTDSGVGSGNYVLFTGLQAADLSLSLEPVDLGAGTLDRNAISGIQIVESTISDDDGDGLLNEWETLYGLDPNDDGTTNPDNGADGDPDMDGSPNSREQEQGTDPTIDDTDGDTLLDGVETGDGVWVDADHRGTNPLSQDSDGDGLFDDVEDNGGVLVDPFTQTGTNPNLPDTDGDGLRDDWEVNNMIDPNDNGDTDPDAGAAGDPDNDGSDNAEEQARGTDPQQEDTDGDTLSDGVETGDGIYVDENATGTDPLSQDSDGDTLFDDAEDNGGTYVDETMTGTNPNLADTDGDGLRDDWEIDNSLNPFDPANAMLPAGGIAMNFGAGRANADLFDTDEVGVFPQLNWNNLAGALGGPLDLLNESGATSGASVSWDLDEEWSLAGPGFDVNGIMLMGWVSANNAGAPNTIDITGIPYSNYDLVVYFNHDRANEDVLISEANDAFTAFVARSNNTVVTVEVAFAQQVASAADVPTEAGNFTIIPDLTAATLNLDLASNNGARGAITGIQIVNRGPAVTSGDVKITNIAVDRTAGTAEITWEAESGIVYAIDGTTDLATPDWQEIQGNLTATQDTLSHTEGGLDFAATPFRFYRVRKLPAP